MFNRMIAPVMIFAFIISCVPEKEKGFASAPVDRALDETARFLAGKEIPAGPLTRFTKTDYFRKYALEIARGWNLFQRPNNTAMKEWWRRYAPGEKHRAVLYPFSGPDIVHALTFFPDADTFIMFGLESPGPIPDMKSLGDAEILNGLQCMKQALSPIFDINFFHTKKMAQTLRHSNFSSIGSMILLFLALHDYEITGSRRIAINADGDLVDGAVSDDRIRWENPPKNRVPGIEISFRKEKGSTQRVRYFMLNVIDYSLENSSPNFIPYLGKEAPFAVVIKSASYLMHNAQIKFTRIRAAVLEQSDFIVQDDSGIPVSYFTPDAWEILYHGYYDRPIPLFANRVQPDLKKAMAEKTTGALPFSYGYNYQPGKSNLMTIRRIRREK